MRRRFGRRGAFAIMFAGVVGALIGVSCTDEGTGTPAYIDPYPNDTGADRRATGGGTGRPRDGGDGDGGTDAGDARPERDANGPLGPDAACAFNYDCQRALRCECVDQTCLCRTGVRGTNVAGDDCTSGNECESAVCFDGRDGERCSDPCTTDDECPATLPACTDVPFTGRICTHRQAR